MKRPTSPTRAPSSSSLAVHTPPPKFQPLAGSASSHDQPNTLPTSPTERSASASATGTRAAAAAQAPPNVHSQTHRSPHKHTDHIRAQQARGAKPASWQDLPWYSGSPRRLFYQSTAAGAAGAQKFERAAVTVPPTHPQHPHTGTRTASWHIRALIIRAPSCVSTHPHTVTYVLGVIFM